MASQDRIQPRTLKGFRDYLPEAMIARERLIDTAKRVYRSLELSGYARLDLRLTPENEIYVIEANATPDIADDEDFALSAKKAGFDYPKLLQRILQLGMSSRPRWKFE